MPSREGGQAAAGYTAQLRAGAAEGGLQLAEARTDSMTGC